MLFYIKYGCSISHEQLIIDAEDFEKANEYAENAAQEVYYSYDCNYPCAEGYFLGDEEMTQEEIDESEYMDMMNDIDWVVEPYDESNEDHVEAMEEQGGIPFEV